MAALLDSNISHEGVGSSWVKGGDAYLAEKPGVGAVSDWGMVVRLAASNGEAILLKGMYGSCTHLTQHQQAGARKRLPAESSVAWASSKMFWAGSRAHQHLRLVRCCGRSLCCLYIASLLLTFNGLVICALPHKLRMDFAADNVSA